MAFIGRAIITSYSTDRAPAHPCRREVARWPRADPPREISVDRISSDFPDAVLDGIMGKAVSVSCFYGAYRQCC